MQADHPEAARLQPRPAARREPAELAQLIQDVHRGGPVPADRPRQADRLPARRPRRGPGQRAGRQGGGAQRRGERAGKHGGGRGIDGRPGRPRGVRRDDLRRHRVRDDRRTCWRTSSSRSSPAAGPGTGPGWGCAISHQIIDQHGGTIAVASGGPGRGSTFAVRLPLRSVGAGDSAGAKHADPGGRVLAFPGARTAAA